MKSSQILAALALLAAAAAQAQVGVSISVNQPGLYGRVDIGSGPPPALIFPQPVIVRSAPVPQRTPVYLRVPPGHEKNWDKHCHKYEACAQPVYFVKGEASAPRDGRHGAGRDEHPGGGKQGGKGEGRGHGSKHD
ncbi:hypothetical protein [Caldimonas tepidiphila]|uniref:hypothetical protein n=1 Tax=Caldimonas tepidiphila TaxID=2315841 RepID=UPI000E5AC6ED|nr:hypothetical protein [Caldimonas tepidiphila]